MKKVKSTTINIKLKKSKMKKVIIILAIVASLTACNKAKTEATTTTEAGRTAPRKRTRQRAVADRNVAHNLLGIIFGSAG